LKYCTRLYKQWRSKGRGQVEAYSSGVARGTSGGTRSGAQQHTFCSHFKDVF